MPVGIIYDNVLQAICVLGGESYKEKCKQLKYCPLDGKDLPLEIKKIVNSVRGKTISQHNVFLYICYKIMLYAC